MHACSPGSLQVGLQVINEDTVGGVQLILVNQKLVEGGVRLNHVDVAGEQSSIHLGEEIECVRALPHDLVGIIGQVEDPPAALLDSPQPGQTGFPALHDAVQVCKHVPDLRLHLRIISDKALQDFFNRQIVQVHLHPIRGPHGGIHHPVRLLSRKALFLQKTEAPQFHQNAAYVKHNCIYRFLIHFLVFSLRSGPGHSEPSLLTHFLSISSRTWLMMVS